MYYARPTLEYQPLPATAYSISLPGRGSPTGGLIAVGLLLGLTATVYGLSSSPITAGVIYAIGFMVLTWSRPGMALMLIVAASPFQNDISTGGGLR